MASIRLGLKGRSAIEQASVDNDIRIANRCQRGPAHLDFDDRKVDERQHDLDAGLEQVTKLVELVSIEESKACDTAGLVDLQIKDVEKEIESRDDNHKKKLVCVNTELQLAFERRSGST